MNSTTKTEAELARRIPYRVYAVQNAGLLTRCGPSELAELLTFVSSRVLILASEYPELGWALLERVILGGLKGAPDTDESGNWDDPREKALNDMLLVGGNFEPMIDMKRYRKYYDVLVFCQDLVSEFRSYALIINKYKPRDAVSEVTACIAEYLAEEFIRLATPIPDHLVEVLGDARIEEMRALEEEQDKLDPAMYAELLTLVEEFETQFSGPDVSEQRERLLVFVDACGDLRELAVELLNFPDDLM